MRYPEIKVKVVTSALLLIVLPLIVLPLIFHHDTVKANSCNYTIEISVSNVDARVPPYSNIKPGDTVCIEAGTRRKLFLYNFLGTADNPIVFINSGGRVILSGPSNAGIKVANSRYIRLTGTGDSNFQYGIQINGRYTLAIHIGWKSSDFEVDHIEASNSGVALKTASRATCSDGSNNDYDYDGDGQIKNDLDDIVTQANFTQHNVVIHDNWVHNLDAEGLYIGQNRTVYDGAGQGFPSNCSAPPREPLNPVLKGVRVYRNLIEDTGWDALSVKGTPEDCLVYSNTVKRDSSARNQGEQGGLNFSINTSCTVYNNWVQDGYGTGIRDVGNGDIKIYNNVVINSGRMFTASNPKGSGILSIPGTAVNGSVYIWNNTIINPTSFGIKFGRTGAIQNNIMVNPGAKVYIQSTLPATISHNLTTMNIDDVQFANPAIHAYSLNSTSPAINTGVDLSAQGIIFDFNYVPRPQEQSFDMGAFEMATANPSPILSPAPTPIINALKTTYLPIISKS